MTYPNLIHLETGHTPCDQLGIRADPTLIVAPKAESATGHTARDQSRKSGSLHPNLSWSLYRHLMRVESEAARGFYEIEVIANNWSARELERQINSLLYERLAKSWALKA